MRTLFRSIFGQVQWQAPKWIPWLGLQFRNAVRFLIADRKRLAIGASTVLAVAVGFTWYAIRPRPRYLLYEVIAPYFCYGLLRFGRRNCLSHSVHAQPAG